MLRSLVKITTGVELGIAALTLFIGISFAALVSVAMEGSPRLLVEAFIAVATLALLAYTGLGICRRYRRLLNGRCGHPVCHGTLAGGDDLPDHLVRCSICRRVWPRLPNMQIEATAE